MTTTQPTKSARTNTVLWRAMGAALVAALARLAIVAALAIWLLIMLLNEVAAALVYAIAAVLALFQW